MLNNGKFSSSAIKDFWNSRKKPFALTKLSDPKRHHDHALKEKNDVI